MKTKTIIITILFLSGCLLAQNRMFELKYNLSEDKFILIDSIVNLYDASGLITESHLNQSEPVNLIQFIYDSKKHLAKEKRFKDDVLKQIIEYEYSETGHLIKENNLDGKGNELFANYLKYDNSNNLVRKKSNISTGQRIENSFNSQKQKIKSVVSGNSRNQTEIEYIYDDKGKVIQETIYQSLKRSKSGKRYQQSKIKFIYDSWGKLSEKQNYLTDEVIEKYSYTYDDNGKLSKWEKFSPQGKLEFYVEYRYQ